MNYLELSYPQVFAATLLVVVNGVISIAFRLGLEKSLFVASLRTVVQLMLIGLVLEWLFTGDHTAVVMAVMVLMTLVAGTTARSRLRRRYQGVGISTVLTMAFSAWTVGSYAALFVFRDVDRHQFGRYAIPLLGMILGNALNGVTIGLNAWLDGLMEHRAQIECSLALGASRWEASQEVMQGAVRTGMIPVINSMLIVGLVSLPGMMTGQLLSGVAPAQAVKYQTVIMFLIAAATSLGTVGSVMLSFRQLSNSRHQFLFDKLHLS